MKKCQYCHEEKQLEYYYEKSHKSCKYCFNALSRIGHLGINNDFTYEDYEYVRTELKINKDDIKQYDLDHFIPRSWGHSISNLGNLYFLKSHYNQRKGDKNPFIAFNNFTRENPEFEQTAEKVVEHIAKMNGLTINELRSFVDWCERNKGARVSNCSKTSMELWRKVSLTLL